MNYWLMKSEPETYGIAHLAREQETVWDGVRNYQARNFLRQMQVGDRAFFYHSNATPPGIAGLMRVIAADLVDPTQFDAASNYYDSKSTLDAPRWQTVKVAFEREFPQLIPLDLLKRSFAPDEFWVVRPGNRLSVMPVSSAVAARILALL